MPIPSIIGSISANKKLKKGQAQADAVMQQAIDELKSIGVPDIEAQKIALSRPDLVFKYNPDLEQVFEISESAFKDISIDPKLRDAQMSALDSLRMASEEAMTPDALAKLNQIQRGIAGKAAGADRSIIQDIVSRGLGGSGQELISRGLANQQLSSEGLRQGDQVAYMAMNNALNNLSKYGGLAGGIREQDYNQELAEAQATDAINRENLGAKMGVQQRNVGSKNQAQLETERLKQDLEGRRVDIANQQEKHNKGLYQQKFLNELAKSGMIAPLHEQRAEQQLAYGKARAENAQNIGQGFTKIGTSLMGMG